MAALGFAFLGEPLHRARVLGLVLKVAQASGAFTRKVEKGDELLSALRQAIEHVRVRRTQALVQIRVAA